MSTLPRTLILLCLVALLLALFHDTRVAMNKPDVDTSRVIVLFVSLVAVGVATAIFVALTVVPRIGDGVGNFFFQPNEKAEKDPHAAAQAALARGDCPEAIEAYEQALEINPADTLAYSEIAKIFCDHLADPAAAAATLERALEHEWSPDDAAFLSTRLVDVYWNFQHNAPSARALLRQIIETMPETRHSANASHRLREIEQQIALEG